MRYVSTLLRFGGAYYYILCYAIVNDEDQTGGYGHGLKPVFLVATLSAAVTICLCTVNKIQPTLPFITLSTGAPIRLFRQRVRVLTVLKVSTIILCTAGFAVNLLGILVWYEYGYVYGWIVERLSQLDSKSSTSTIPNQHTYGVNSMEVMTWNPSYSPIILHGKALMSGFVNDIQPRHDWMSYGLAPCAYDLYFFCKFAPTSILILLPLIAFLGTIIVNQIRHENDSGKVITSFKKYS